MSTSLDDKDQSSSLIFVQALVELLSEGDIARRATFPEKADIRSMITFYY